MIQPNHGTVCAIYSKHCTFDCRPDPTRLLLTFGASVNARERVNGNTALHWACSVGNHAVVKLLLDAGADITAENGRVCCS